MSLISDININHLLGFRTGCIDLPFLPRPEKFSELDAALGIGSTF
jgi:hypothetical protein